MNIHFQAGDLRRIALLTLGASSLASISQAQITFSVDWNSAALAVPDTCGGVPMTEGDILIPAAGVPTLGPAAPPCIAIPGGPGGLGLLAFGACIGHPPGTPCRVEVDALSYGRDHPMGLNSAAPGSYLFSTDAFATAGVPPVLFPSIASESPSGDSAPDVWVNGGPLPLGPLPPFAALVGHLGVIDGNGFISGSSAVYPGMGLAEPSFPQPAPTFGDNIDALDHDPSGLGGAFPPTGVYFSLDAAFPDPFTGFPHSASAAANGFSGADVLVSLAPGGPPVVYAPSFLLGLELTGVADDVDALALRENGAPGFQPSQQPNDWLTPGGPDMLLFSVRRGSGIIGMPDSIFGLPINEGDILTTPLPTIFGGVSPFPGIYCAAENIGLNTSRIAGVVPDDLNALDTIVQSNLDCNGNGVSDLIDIISGTSTDINSNGIPDDCEIIGGPGCFCFAPFAPCGNPYPTGGCKNSTGLGALLTASGTGSVSLDNLVLTGSQMPPAKPGIFFGGPLMVGPLPFGDGLRCAGGGIVRFTTPTLTSATGTLTAGPGLAFAFGILPSTTMNFQCWFRDPAGPCSTGFNTSNSYTVIFTP